MDPHKVEGGLISLSGSSFVRTRNPKEKSWLYHDQQTSKIPLSKLLDHEASLPLLKYFQNLINTSMGFISVPINVGHRLRFFHKCWWNTRWLFLLGAKMCLLKTPNCLTLIINLGKSFYFKSVHNMCKL